MFEKTKGLFQALTRKYAAYILILPSIFMIALVLYFPMAKGILMAFHVDNLSPEPVWSGVQNYIELITDPDFLYSVRVTILFLLGTISLQILIGLGTALVVDKIKKFKMITTPLAVAPYMVPPVAGGIIWYWMLDPSVGLINHILYNVHLPPVYFRTTGFLPIISVIVAQAWKDYGYATIIYVAYLKSIPGHLYEAASIDGANAFQKFRFITLPRLRNATLIILTIRTVWNIVELALPLELTHGGPGIKTTLLSIFLYRVGFVDIKLGKAYAVGIFMIAMALGAFFIFSRLLGGIYEES